MTFYSVDSRVWGDLSDEEFAREYKNGTHLRAQIEHCLCDDDIDGSATLIAACLFADKSQKERSFQALGWFFAGLPPHHGLPLSFLNELFHQSLLTHHDYSYMGQFLKEGAINTQKLVDVFFHEDTISDTLERFYPIKDTGAFSVKKASALIKVTLLLKNDVALEKIKNHLFNSPLTMNVLDQMLSNPVLKDEAFQKLDDLYQKQMSAWMSEAPHFLSIKQKKEILQEIGLVEETDKHPPSSKKM